MVRVGGLQHTIDPNQPIGKRITDMLGGKPLETGKPTRWPAGPIEEARQAGGAPSGDVMARGCGQTRKSALAH
jgi:sulfur-oxidizing protein SoxB